MLAPVQEQMPMNRAQRKAWDKLQKSASFKNATPYRQAVELHRNGLGFMIPKEVYTDVSVPNLKPIALLNDCRPFQEGELDYDIVRIRSSYDRIKEGAADEDDFQLLGVALNLARVRAEDIDQRLVNMITPDQDAMNRCRERYIKTKRLGFDGPGIREVLEALDAHDAILEKSSPKQMQDAAKVVRKILKKQTASAGAVELN